MYSRAVLDVLAERKKQVAKGYTPEHDDEHDMGELRLAAALDALPYDTNINGEPLLTQDDYISLHIALETGLDFYLQPIENERDRLIRASALLIAELERLDRAAIIDSEIERNDSGDEATGTLKDSVASEDREPLKRRGTMTDMLKSECCDAEVRGRYCAKCGQECRVVDIEIANLKAELATHGKTCLCAHSGTCGDRTAWLASEIAKRCPHETVPANPVWNVGGKQLGRECEDHPAVRGTSYQEVYALIGTAGCSSDATMWDWSRLGVIETKRGRLVVYPGDSIIERDSEFYPRAKSEPTNRIETDAASHPLVSDKE